jgi:hypothetical protein
MTRYPALHPRCFHAIRRCGDPVACSCDISFELIPRPLAGSFYLACGGLCGGRDLPELCLEVWV